MLGTLLRRLFKGPTPMLQPGDLCPQFSVLDSDCNRVTQADFLGKRVVVWFYPIAGTPG